MQILDRESDSSKRGIKEVRADTNAQEFGTICWSYTCAKHVTSTQVTEEADWIVDKNFVQTFIA